MVARNNNIRDLHRTMKDIRYDKIKSLSEVEDDDLRKRKEKATSHCKTDRVIALEKQKVLKTLALSREKRQQQQHTDYMIYNQLMYEYNKQLLDKSIKSNKNKSNAQKECLLNFAGAALAMIVSFASGGLIPSLIMLVAGLATMGGFFYKSWTVSDDVKGGKRTLIKSMLAGSFMKRTDDILKGCFMIGGLTGVMLGAALPFAIITFAASALAFAASAYEYKRNPSKAAKYGLAGTGLNLLGSMAMTGVAIAALIVGAAALSNPIGLAIIGTFLVAGAIVKLKISISKSMKAKEKLKDIQERHDYYEANLSGNKNDNLLSNSMSLSLECIDDIINIRAHRANNQRENTKFTKKTREPLRWTDSIIPTRSTTPSQQSTTKQLSTPEAKSAPAAKAKSTPAARFTSSRENASVPTGPSPSMSRTTTDDKPSRTTTDDKPSRTTTDDKPSRNPNTVKKKK
ncbi:MAG: hypothetical protein HOI53_08645 [Francisellaceae bacterium]|nr:hypothetical protein [Francisellaceae bacterium]MBT6208083.1 hypothetical protein [Francisellaceae bacterium]MBT6537870.1 hypothetical protein [Francisellaceae bacterium]